MAGGDGAPVLLMEAISAADAEEVRSRITKVGGSVAVTLRETPIPGGPRGLGSTAKAGKQSAAVERQFDLILGDNHDDDDDTHEVANAVRDVLDIGLQEAMDLVVRAPCVLIEGVSRADAYAVEQHVMEAGGDIKWVERSVPMDGETRRPSDRFFAAFDEDLYRDLMEMAADEERDASEDSGEDEDEDEDDGMGCLGCLGVMAVCGLFFAGCMRLCGG